MNILNRYLECIGNKVEIETLPANELDHLSSKFFMHVKKSDGSEYEPSTVSTFQRVSKDILTIRKEKYISSKTKSSTLLEWFCRPSESHFKLVKETSLWRPSHYQMPTRKSCLPRANLETKALASSRGQFGGAM